MRRRLPLLVLVFILIVVVVLAATWLQARPSDEGDGDLAPQEFMQLKMVERAAERDALCVDGSEAAYYLRPGVGSGADNWVVWFEGGSSCHTEADCVSKVRRDSSFSSSKLKGQKAGGGIFSIDAERNPDFYNWNHVYLNNCNGGNFGAEDEVVIKGHTLYFHGYNIVQAVFEDLDIKDAERILVTGSSGGGTGVGMNLDRIAAWYPQTDVRGVVDSSYELDYAPYATTKVADMEQGFAFTTTHVDESCAAAHPNDPWSCNLKEILYPYLSTPVFTYQDLIDEHKLEDFGITDRQQAPQASWVSGYESALIDSLEKLDGVFAPASGDHTALMNERFFTTTIEGYAFAQVLGNWVFDRPGPTQLIAQPE